MPLRFPEPSFRSCPTPRFSVLAEGLEFPEGPVAMSDGSFLVVEIKGGKLKRIAADGAVETVAVTGGGPNGAAIGPDGHCYITNNGGHKWAVGAEGPAPAGLPDDYTSGKIQRVNLTNGRVDDLYTRHDRGPLTSPNDLVFDSVGGIWFTDVGKKKGRELHYGSVCYALPDGSSIKEVIFPMMSPNGIGISPNGDVLYVAETATSRIWCFDITGPGTIAKASGTPHGGRLLCNLGGYRMPDSLAVDSEGYVHVATLMDSGIAKVSPDGAQIVHMQFPDTYTTNLCFGGDNLSIAYVTLTQSGRLIAFDPGVRGLPLHFSR
jgi:gluconolactonase